jgi:hypothetical protein
VSEAGEECDTSDLAGQSCQSLGFDGGVLACDGTCSFDTAACNACGDGTADPGEQCDGTDLDAQTCQGLGYFGGTLACTAACELDTQACTTLHSAFVAKFVKATGLTKPLGAQRLAMRSTALDASGTVFDVPSEPVTITVWNAGVKTFEATIPAGDPVWKVKPTRARWKARSAIHPAGLASLVLSTRSDEIRVKVKAVDTALEALAGAAVLEVALTIGDDVWFGPSPACSTSGSGGTLKCR